MEDYLMKYEAPETEIVDFENTDIITESGTPTPADDKSDPYAVDNFN